MRRHKPKAPPAVREKTKVLIDEGQSPEQAYATAWSMKRAGRLRRGGVYIHKRTVKRARRS